MTTNPDARKRLLRRGYALEIVTVTWNVLEGIIAVAAGAVAGSVALIGFGIDSFVETGSALVVGWRLRREIRGETPRRAEEVERTASRIAGALLFVLAAYIVIDAGRRLAGVGERAGESMVGIVLTSLSLIVMPILGRAKLRVSRAIGSPALRADAYETIACAWLSFTTLAGLALNALAGWWWADPLAALVLVPLIVREGLHGWRGESCGEAASSCAGD